MGDTTTGHINEPPTVADDPASVEGWDFDALNDRARELRGPLRDGGLDGLMSQVAGETVRLAPTGKRVNPSSLR